MHGGAALTGSHRVAAGRGGEAHRLLSSELYSSSFMRGASAATEGKEQLMYRTDPTWSSLEIAASRRLATRCSYFAFIRALRKMPAEGRRVTG